MSRIVWRHGFVVLFSLMLQGGIAYTAINTVWLVQRGIIQAIPSDLFFERLSGSDIVQAFCSSRQTAGRAWIVICSIALAHRFAFGSPVPPSSFTSSAHNPGPFSVLAAAPLPT